MSELIERIDFCLKYDELPTVARQTFEQCKAALSQQAELVSILESTIQTGLRIDAKVAQQEAEPVERCILCANGNDLPEGEYCRGCGRENNLTPLGRAVRAARGSESVPSAKLEFAAPKPAPLPQPTKPVECEIECPEQQICDYCQYPQPVASVPQDVEKFANDVAEWSQTQFEDVIRVSHFREFMRQRDAGHARVPVELSGKQWSTMRDVVSKYADRIQNAERYEMVSAYLDAAPAEIHAAMITASQQEGV